MIKVVKERKKRYNNEIDRVQANRRNKARYQAKRRERLKREKLSSKNEFTNDKYKDDIYSKIKCLYFNYQGTLRFNRYKSIESATKAVSYFCKKISKFTSNIAYTFEYGSDNNIHVHMAYSFKEVFLEMYSNKQDIQKYLHSIWNFSNIKNGAVWVRRFKDDSHKCKYLRYMFKDVLPASKWHYRQKQVDLYFIKYFEDEVAFEHGENRQRSGFIEKKTLNMVYVSANYNVEDDHMNPAYIWVDRIMKKYKHQIITLVIAAVWLLMI